MPFGSVPVVIANVEVAADTVMVNAPVPVALFASLACAVNAKLPVADGVPLMVPLLANASPVGSVPESRLKL